MLLPTAMHKWDGWKWMNRAAQQGKECSRQEGEGEAVKMVAEEEIMTGDRVVDSVLDKIILLVEPKTGRTFVRNRTEGRRGGTMNPTSILIGMSGLEESGVAVLVLILPLSLVLLLSTRKYQPPAGSVGVARADRAVEVEALRHRRLLRRRAAAAAAVEAVEKIAG
jgi:hypothetical protein